MKKTKYIIFDAGPLISMTMNGLLPILEKLKQKFNGEFIITPDVKKEVVDKPLKVKRYEFEAVKIKNLIDRGVLKMSSEFVADHLLEKENLSIMKSANNLFKARDEWIKLLHKGECSCLAFSKLCKNESVIVIDERTTRMLTEGPESLKELMERKLHTNININQQKLNLFKGFKYIRSSELVYIAYKKGLFDLIKDKTLLDALLYAVKYKGTAISSREIEEIKQMA